MRSGFMGCSLEYTNLPKLWLQKQDTFRFLSKSIKLSLQAQGKQFTTKLPFTQLYQKCRILENRSAWKSFIIIVLDSTEAMLIEMDKYQPNSLRKGRRDALEKDISDGYTLFAYRYNDPRIITSNDFNDFWTASQLNFIPHIRCEQEDEQQYFQVIYRILINDYFLRGNESKKIYALLCMYFFAYSIDSNGDRNLRQTSNKAGKKETIQVLKEQSSFIHVTQDFVLELTSFLRQNTDYSKYFFVKVVKKMKQLFVYSIKTGLRNPLIKKNGETFVRYPKPLKKFNKDNYSPTISEIKEGMNDLQKQILSYHEAKEQYLSILEGEQSGGVRKQFTFDKNITQRLRQIIKSYDSDMTYMEEEIKNVGDCME